MRDFAHSHGEIVMFLDADDVLLPNAVEEVVRAWHPGVAKAQFVLAHIDADGRALGRTVPYLPAQMPDGDIRASILDAGGYIGVPTSGNAFARTVLERLLPLPESQWRQAADTSLEIIAPFLGDVVSIRKTLGCYRIHEANHGMLGDELDSRKLRVKIVIDLQREWALSEFASRSGFTIPRNWAAREPAHLKYRLASLRIDPAHHPLMDDRPMRLMLMGLEIFVAQSRIQSSKSRIFHTFWFPLAALLPQAAAVKVVRRGLLPGRGRAKAPRLPQHGWLAIISRSRLRRQSVAIDALIPHRVIDAHEYSASTLRRASRDSDSRSAASDSSRTTDS